ncbi:MAG: asparagine synthase (glutamine-hydrolyzing) [Cytophagales bacterium]|nr:asparagine synthase (glutamine-hydrolyzing) [Cytophagales bacterium]
MCGIAGIVKKHSSVTKDELTYFEPFLKERGPDSTGYWNDKNVGLVHTRLKIIDLSDEANQPMEDDRSIIVFNGEIYNFQRLKNHFNLSEYEFRTDSDTEVILAGFQVWGFEGLMERLDGMFAIALYDKHEEVLFLARDRFGKKPLYYHEDANGLTFSSDIRSLQQLRHVSIDMYSLAYYFKELSVPQPSTIWKEIKQISGGSYLRYDLNKSESTFKKFWSLKSKETIVDEQEALNTIEVGLKDAILKRMVSDVPIGCFLSGGIDSGLVVSMLASHSSEKVNTYTVGIEGGADEREEARLVARRYDTNHEEIVLSGEEIGQGLDQIISYVGEPFADSSLIPSYHITRQIKRFATVALSGDGGDELFGGYSQYLQAYHAEMLATRYHPALRQLAVLGDKVLGRIQRRENLGSYQAFLKMSPAGQLSRYMGFDDHMMKELNPEIPRQAPDELLDGLWERTREVQGLTKKLMMTSLDTRLINDYLVKVDRASMMNSLEVRSPFLDANLAEIAYSIDTRLMYRNGNAKYLLRKLAEKYVRKNAMTESKKGFSVPIDHWIRNSLKQDIHGRLENLKQRNLMNASAIDRLSSEHLLSRGDHRHRIWLLYCLEIWFEKFNPNFRL